MYQETSPNNMYKGRYRVILLILILCMLAVTGRIIYLTIFNRNFLKNQGDMRAVRVVELPASRGMILDRNGYPLAISTPVDSVWVDPSNFDLSNSNNILLAKYLDLSHLELQDRIKKNAKREFLYLKRGLDPAIGEKIKALKIPGVYIQQEYRRFYPEGEVTAHLLGFTNVDDHGQEGLELAYNSWLAGEPGKTEVLRDRYGKIVADLKLIKQASPGRHLMTSIDRRIQFLAYQALQEGAEKYHASAGTAIVLDVKSGEVLADVNVPSYNPNNRPSGHREVYRNRAFTDLYEPGSVMKGISMVSALSSGKFKPDSKVDTSPGYMSVDGSRIEDEHNNGVIDMATLLALSSNVGMTKVTLALPYDRLWQTMHLFGFGQGTGSNFPGESSGLLRRENPWKLIDLVHMSFGYALSATPIQVARAYAALGNDGRLVPVSLLKLSQPPKGEQIISPTVAHQMLELLESVIYMKGGTAPLAKVPGYRITGKTGTAWVLGPHGYLKNVHNGTFVGLVPAKNPQILILVVLYDIRGRLSLGGYTAGPVFAKIAEGTLHLLGTLPDDASSDTAPPPEAQAVNALAQGQEAD
jgi:cell division protein FtsI (penicillin-binding protein 3)